jgi:hypothetical protein
MTKSKTWTELARSLDEDWPPHQPMTLMDLAPKPVPSIGISLVGVTRAAMTPATRMPVTCLNACWLMPDARGAQA